MKLRTALTTAVKFFLALFLVGSTTHATAKEWFVAPSPRGVDTNSGDAEHPFATINKGAAFARAGDTVWVSPGTYQPADIIRPARSGTADSPITYRARGGEVIIDGRGKVPNYPWDGVFTIGKKSWIVLDGLHVINSHWFGISANDATGVTVQNCSTKNTLASGIYIRNSSHVKVLHNSVQGACRHPSSTPLKDTQECLSLSSCTEFEVACNTIFDRMEDSNNGGEGIDTKDACRNGKVHHNHVFNLVRLGIYADSFGSRLEECRNLRQHRPRLLFGHRGRVRERRHLPRRDDSRQPGPRLPAAWHTIGRLRKERSDPGRGGLPEHDRAMRFWGQSLGE